MLSEEKYTLMRRELMDLNNKWLSENPEMAYGDLIRLGANQYISTFLSGRQQNFECNFLKDAALKYITECIESAFSGK